MTKFKDLFWRSEPEVAAPGSTTSSTRRAPTASPRAADSAPRANEPPATATSATGAVTTGDPRVDQLLVAFEAMRASIPPAQLAVAIAATAKAIGAEAPVVVTTLGQRLTALEAAHAARTHELDERQRTRRAELDAAIAKVEAEIEGMTQRTATLRQQIAGATARVAELTARDQAEAAAGTQRGRDEAARLSALRDFLTATAS